MFLRDIHARNLSLKETNKERIQLVNELEDMGKGKISVEQIYFLKNAGLLISARDKILNSFKGKIFPTKIPDKIKSLKRNLNLNLNQQ